MKKKPQRQAPAHQHELAGELSFTFGGHESHPVKWCHASTFVAMVPVQGSRQNVGNSTPNPPQSRSKNGQTHLNPCLLDSTPRFGLPQGPLGMQKAITDLSQKHAALATGHLSFTV